MRLRYLLLGFGAALLSTNPASAQLLEKIEKSHSPPPKKSPDDGQTDKYSGDSSSAQTPVVSPSSASSSVPNPRDTRSFCLFAELLLPPLSGLCHVRTYTTIEPYDDPSDLYIRAPEDASEEGATPRPPATASRTRRRAEFDLNGFAGAGTSVRGAGFQLRGYLGQFYGQAEWVHLTEANAPNLQALELLRFAIGSNWVGSDIRTVEIGPVTGLLLLHGSEWTPAFDAGMELRAYPQKPIAVRASFHAAFFQHGPPLFDTRVEPGVTFGRLELRVGARWMTESDVATIVGPSVSLSGRW